MVVASGFGAQFPITQHWENRSEVTVGVAVSGSADLDERLDTDKMAEWFAHVGVLVTSNKTIKRVDDGTKVACGGRQAGVIPQTANGDRCARDYNDCVDAILTATPPLPSPQMQSALEECARDLGTCLDPSFATDGHTILSSDRVSAGKAWSCDHLCIPDPPPPDDICFKDKPVPSLCSAPTDGGSSDGGG